MFYDKVLEIYTQGEGFLNDEGIWINGDEILLKVIQVDIQPYSSELLYKDYGYREQVTKRVFCDVDKDIKNGLTTIYDGKRFKIKRIIPWDDYMELMLDDE